MWCRSLLHVAVLANPNTHCVDATAQYSKLEREPLACLARAPGFAGRAFPLVLPCGAVAAQMAMHVRRCLAAARLQAPHWYSLSHLPGACRPEGPQTGRPTQPAAGWNGAVPSEARLACGAQALAPPWQPDALPPPPCVSPTAFRAVECRQLGVLLLPKDLAKADMYKQAPSGTPSSLWRSVCKLCIPGCIP